MANQNEVKYINPYGRCGVKNCQEYTKWDLNIGQNNCKIAVCDNHFEAADQLIIAQFARYTKRVEEDNKDVLDTFYAIYNLDKKVE